MTYERLNSLFPFCLFGHGACSLRSIVAAYIGATGCKWETIMRKTLIRGAAAAYTLVAATAWAQSSHEVGAPVAPDAVEEQRARRVQTDETNLEEVGKAMSAAHTALTDALQKEQDIAAKTASDRAIAERTAEALAAEQAKDEADRSARALDSGSGHTASADADNEALAQDRIKRAADRTTLESYRKVLAEDDAALAAVRRAIDADRAVEEADRRIIESDRRDLEAAQGFAPGSLGPGWKRDDHAFSRSGPVVLPKDPGAP